MYFLKICNIAEPMTLSTERLILRPWKEDDAPSLYEYAKHPEIGPAAGWPVHTDVEHSRHAIKEYLSAEGIYAIVLKGTHTPIGSVGVLIGEKSDMGIGSNEGEIGYWIGVPYWGQGLIPEAVREIMRYSFEDLGLAKLWCGYFDGNEKSLRVQEKCGFRYHHTQKDKKIPLINAVRTEHVTYITKEQWCSNHTIPL